jgi:hypothetical protein
MSTDQAQRPRFYEGQYLSSRDLAAAVDYGRGVAARHALGSHTWGIAIGLNLREVARPGSSTRVDVSLEPGYAWDGFGRPVVVLAPYKIPEALFGSIKYDATVDSDGTGRLVEVWVRYREIDFQAPAPGFEVCDTADRMSRVQETFCVAIGPKPEHFERHDLLSVGGKSTDALEALRVFDPQASRIFDESIPHQSLPDPQDKAQWFIPIGYVRWLPVHNGTGGFVARAADDADKSRSFRVYAGLVAETIEAADGAIRLRDRGVDPSKSSFQAPTDDLVWVEGNLRVEGDVKIAGGVLDFRKANGEDGGSSLLVQRSGDNAPADTGTRALQIAIGPKSQTNNLFAVGPLKETAEAGADRPGIEEKFVVQSGGNVGIGTSTPTSMVEIKDGDLLFSASAEDAGDLVFQNSSGKQKGRIWSGTTSDAALMLSSGDTTADLAIDKNGNVGIGTSEPQNTLDVRGGTGIRQNSLHLSGKEGGSSLSYNAYRNEANTAWVIQDSQHKAVAINLDDKGDIPRFEVLTNWAADINGWTSRLKIEGKNGNVLMAINGGRVGIGTATPKAILHVSGSLRILPDTNPLRVTGVWVDDSDLNSSEISNDITVFKALVIGGNRSDGGTYRMVAVKDDLVVKHDLVVNNDLVVNSDLTVNNTLVVNKTLVVNLDLTVDHDLIVYNDLTVNHYFYLDGHLIYLSDESLKKDIRPLERSLESLTVLRGVRYSRLESKAGEPERLGLVAQEVEAVYPELVITRPDGKKGIDYIGLIAPIIESVKQLQEQVSAMKVEIAILKKGREG